MQQKPQIRLQTHYISIGDKPLQNMDVCMKCMRLHLEKFPIFILGIPFTQNRGLAYATETLSITSGMSETASFSRGTMAFSLQDGTKHRSVTRSVTACYNIMRYFTFYTNYTQRNLCKYPAKLSQTEAHEEDAN